MSATPSTSPSPIQILETLFPSLKAAAGYARQIQGAIARQPSKENTDNPFAAALTDADLSIQTMIEVALLGAFPNIRFYGEEYEQSHNTKYFRSTELGAMGDYLVTLDPVDGTRFYMDGHPNYQIILGILNADEFEAVIAVSPAYGTFDYALRGQGLLRGRLEDGLASATPYRVEATDKPILLGTKMGILAQQLGDRYSIIDVIADYSTETRIPNVNGVLYGELSAAVIRAGKFIDGAALAFLAQEAGCKVTTLDGSAPPPLYACKNYQRPGMILSTSSAMHQDLVNAAQALGLVSNTNSSNSDHR